MAGIRLDIKKVRSTNTTLPPLATKLSGIKRGLGLLRWRIPDNIQEEIRMKERIEELLREIERAEAEINEIYTVTNSSIAQYMNVEERLSANAERFL